MADKKDEKKPSYLKELMRFYMAPELHSVGTVLYLIVFSFFAFYYLDNVFLALKFLWYIFSTSTALSGISYLFTSLGFVLFLLLPFSTSLYAVFVVHEIWKKKDWSSHVKLFATAAVTISALCIVIITDNAARVIARQPMLQSFIEDHNLNGKI